MRKKKKLKKRAEPDNYTGRKYEDYLRFKILNPEMITTEMDTVYNSQSGPFIQTFIFENTGLIIHSQEKKLSGKTPYEVFKFMYGKRILDRLNIKEIKKDDVNITPSRLK
ncbi:MAG: hypothetical protein IJH12_01630 [Clostridia bacterium]|nr:hypothetical protein [Clostridia bacterium]